MRSIKYIWDRLIWVLRGRPLKTGPGVWTAPSDCAVKMFGVGGAGSGKKVASK